MTYRVEFTRAAQRDLRSFPQDIQARLDTHIVRLADIPRPPGAVKLTGAKNLFRLRVGQYRIIYSIDDKTQTVIITRLAHRREVYR